jgi:hypothetical protein
MSTAPVKQRADLTHKHNMANGRHGWLRLTPAYSVNIVNDILKDLPGGLRVLDPFSGTATTPLCAAYRGLSATSIDINPFLVWLGKAKVSSYERTELVRTYELALQAMELVSQDTIELCSVPLLSNIERWWDTSELNFLRKLKTCIKMLTLEDTPGRTLLLLAFCRTMIRTSNASFDHQSMSFKEEDRDVLQIPLFGELSDKTLIEMYRKDVEYILKSAEMNPVIPAEVLPGDSRTLQNTLGDQYDVVITSPPYPNRMSYIRELRPYMYWLDYFSNAREAGELDWQAIGGTWGIATSRLLEWQKSQDTYCPAYLNSIIAQIASAENKNGKLLSIYVAKYFEDIWSHLRNLIPFISSGGELHYIVGNSTFYDVLVPVEKIYRDMMLELGLVDASIKVLRKRNSNKVLFEYRVSARKR